MGEQPVVPGPVPECIARYAEGTVPLTEAVPRCSLECLVVAAKLQRGLRRAVDTRRQTKPRRVAGAGFLDPQPLRATRRGWGPARQFARAPLSSLGARPSFTKVSYRGGVNTLSAFCRTAA
jgi:hypothetical protein